MKKTLLTLTSVLFCAISFAQSVPQGINYQAVARDATGNEITNQSLTVQLSIFSGSTTGTVSWQETHAVTTNDYGLFTVIIGQGTSSGSGSSATFDAVDWGAAPHYLKVEVDDGSGLVDMGTTAFMSVPYALQAGNPGPAGPTGVTGAIGPQGPIGLTGPPGNSFWQDLGNGDISTTITGNVGIGTGINPIRGKLEISGNQACCGTTQGDFWYYLYNVPNGQFQYYNGNSNFDISVYADGRFMGSGIHIFSDERIKDIVGLSDSKNDLSTLLSLQITNYKMKDKAKGDKPYKKVIAQQVKEVYPQAISVTTEVVPDIYAVASIENGFISLETNLKKGEKVRLIFEDETSLFDVLSADKNGFKVSIDKSGKVFVYGREVDDFHSVDYESLSMLNVSATQELYKLITQQQKVIENQNTEMVEMQTNFDERLKEIEQILNTTTSNKID